MALSGALHSDTARAFDQVAEDYDRTNTENPILAHMRARVMSAVRRHVPPDSSLLDLGCGPGTDHPALSQAGYHVVGIDASYEMVRRANARAGVRPNGPRPAALHRAIQDVSAFGPRAFDAALSNFGPLNCIADLPDTARQLHEVIRPGGTLVVSVIGRLCPWEIAFYAARGDLSRALVRFQRGPVAVPLQQGTVWTHYVTPREFQRIFVEAGFARREWHGLGVVAPPPYLEAAARRSPRVVRALLAADEAVGRWPLFRSCGDHFLMVLGRG